VRLQSAWQLGREAALLGDDLRDDWEPKSDALLCARHSGDGLFRLCLQLDVAWADGDLFSTRHFELSGAAERDHVTGGADNERFYPSG